MAKIQNIVLSTSVYIYIHTHKCTHRSMHMHTHIHTYMQIHVHAHTHTHTHACTRAHTRAHTHTCMHTHTHTCMHTHTHTCAHTHTQCTHTHACAHTHTTHTHTHTHTHTCTHVKSNRGVWRAQTASWSKGLRYESLQEWWDNCLLQGQLSVLTLVSVSIPHPSYRSGTPQLPVILPKVQVVDYSQTHMHATYICGFE